MGLAALIGMALSGIGVALVYITFAETRLTNRIAMKEGARSTRRALASAEETAKALELAASTAAAAKEANELAKGESWRMIIKSAVDAFNREKELKIAQQSAEAAMKSVAISEDTAKRQLRAYVALRDATIALSQPPDEPAVASLVNVVNSGTTPAFNISAQTGLFIGPDESELPPIPPVERVKLTLGKDTPYTFANRLLPSPEMMAAVREGRLNVYAFGRIEYDDAFGAPHFLEFRMVYDPTRGIGAMIPSLTGNDAD
jgi:hypothetical protein